MGNEVLLAGQGSTWTTATRPTSPATNTQGYNTTIGAMEFYNGSAWIPVGANDGSSALRAGTSAAAIKAATGTTVNGPYWIKASTNAPAQLIYCIMDTTVDSAGGWMILSHNSARYEMRTQTIQARPTAYTPYVGSTSGSSYDPYGVWNVHSRDISFTNAVFCVYQTSFTNILAYAYASFTSSQTIPTETSTWTMTPNTTGQILGNLGNKRIWGNSSTQYTFYNFGVQPSGTGGGSGGAFYPYFATWWTGLSAGSISFTDSATANAATTNTYGFEDWQDGNGLGDVWGVEGQGQNAYRGYPSFFMVR